MELTFDTVDNVHVCRLAGRLEAAVSDDFRAALEQVTTQCPGPIVLDMEGVGFIGSACLGALVNFQKKLGDQQTLAISGLSVPIHKMFVVATFDKIFKIAGTADEGVALLKGA